MRARGNVKVEIDLHDDRDSALAALLWETLEDAMAELFGADGRLTVGDVSIEAAGKIELIVEVVES